MRDNASKQVDGEVKKNIGIAFKEIVDFYLNS